MRKPLVLASLLLSLPLGACGGSNVSAVSTPDTAEVSGTIEGAAFRAQSTLALYGETSSNATIVLYDSTNACPSALSTTGTRITFDVSDTSAGTTVTAVGGAYVIGPDGGSRYATSTFATGAAAGTEATSGVVDITKNENAGLRGTFDVQFTDGTKLSGSFDAIYCAGLAQPG